jgi:uncharacterized membrane protein YcfT
MIIFDSLLEIMRERPYSSRLASLILIIGTALWSIARLFSWVILSIVGYLWMIVSACQAIELRKSAKETLYNFLNYPDEINITPQ